MQRPTQPKTLDASLMRQRGNSDLSFSNLGRIQDLVKGGSEKCLPTLTNCCYLTSRFFTRKGMVKIF